MNYKDYYKILGVPKGADDKAIKAAYRKLARKYHPDVNKGSADRFKEINEAHTVLSDPEKRKRYDTLGPDWERYAQQARPRGGRSPFEGQEVRFETGGDGAGFSDFFRTIFGDLGGAGRGRGGGFRDVEFHDVGDLGGAEWGAADSGRPRAVTSRPPSSSPSRRRSRARGRPSRSSSTTRARRAAAPAT